MSFPEFGRVAGMTVNLRLSIRIPVDRQDVVKDAKSALEKVTLGYP